MKIIEIEETDSTNEYCKRLDGEHDVIVIARRQSAGKGTKGRSFVSSDGGLYVSFMRKYFDFAAENAFKIMINASVAVCRTLENFGLDPVIRWPNDVLVGGKKICGTLIENTFSNGNIVRSIVGCGININNELPAELSGIAVSMKGCAGKVFSVKEVADTFIHNIRKEFTITEYKSYINWFDCAVILRTAEGDTEAFARDIAEDGRLIAEIGGEIKKISSAEVSLRLNG